MGRYLIHHAAVAATALVSIVAAAALTFGA